MGRLRSDETLVSLRLEKGESLFPPVPPTKKLVLKKGEKLSFRVPPTKKRFTQDSIPKLDGKKICRENSHSKQVFPTKEPGGRIEEGNAETIYMESKTEEMGLPPPLLRLCHPLDATLNKSQLPAALLNGYAFAAESVKKALISEFTTRDNFDVESMVDVANNAFTVLGSLYDDFTDLYNTVRDFILYHWQLSVAKKELERNGCLQDMEAHHGDLSDQSDLALEALLDAKASLFKTKEEVTPLVSRD